MATMKIKELFNMVESPFVLDPTMAYPEIEGNTSNFLEDYNDNKALYDYYFIKEHGSKLVDVEGEEDSDIIANWKFEIKVIQRIYLKAWARIYYTLDIAYNPVYNVEEHITNKYGDHETETEYGAHETEMEYGAHETEREYGAHETETEYGAHETETEYGNTSDTLGSHTDTATSYAVSFDSQTEKETGKTSNVIGSQTNTSTAHTDTETSKLHTDTTTSKLHTDTETSKLHTDTTTSKLHTDTTTSKLHTDTVDRTGNIGIKSASALADEEVLLREKMIFFKNIFLTISREVGAYYDN